MGYFDGLTDGVFKTDSEGKFLFYPWGVPGKGYILPDDSDGEWGQVLYLVICHPLCYFR